MVQTAVTNRQELVRAIDSAFDAYEAELSRLGKAIDPTWTLGGLAAAHTFIGSAADDAYAAFKVEQVRLNVAYGRYADAPELVKQARAGYDRDVHNAQSLVDSAQHWYDQVHLQLERVRAGEYAQWGVTEPDQSGLDAERERLAALQATQADFEVAKERAAAKRDSTIAAIEAIRPGVTAETANAPAEGPVTTVRMRPQRILEGADTYTGRMTRRGWPYVRDYARHIGMRDLTRREIRAHWLR